MSSYVLSGHWVAALRYAHQYNFKALMRPIKEAWPLLQKTLPAEVALSIASTPDEVVHTPFITLADPTYPQQLRQIPCPPPVLFYQGNLRLLQQPSIAIVGTRKCSTQAKHLTAAFSGSLSVNNVIVSGLAYGVDHIAHLNALPQTIGVCGQGLESKTTGYRQRTHQLVQNGGGLLISEFHPLQAANKWTYVQRNRTIAGLSKALIVMEAPLRSGALISANFAVELGREVYAVPSHPNHLQGRGSLQLLRDGALFAIDPIDIDQSPQKSWKHPLLQMLHHPKTTEDLLLEMNVPLVQLQEDLLFFQAKGVIKPVGPYWQLLPPQKNNFREKSK